MIIPCANYMISLMLLCVSRALIFPVVFAIFSGGEIIMVNVQSSHMMEPVQQLISGFYAKKAVMYLFGIKYLLGL